MKINESNLKFKGSTYGNIPKSIVLHHAEAKQCSIYDIHNWHLGNGWSGCGYHFLVRKDGSIWRGRPENTIGAHVAGFNTNSLGICAEGEYMTEIMPETQKQAIIELCKYLCKKYNINKIYGHREVGTSSCPGAKYPLEEIRSTITQAKSNPYIKLDGGGTIVGSNLAINLIIRDYKKVDRVFGHIEGVNNALWAFDVNPTNNNYAKLEKNTNQIAVYKGLEPNKKYKIIVSGYKNEKKVTETSIVLKTLQHNKHTESNKLYKIQVGAFKDKNNAQNLKEELKSKGYDGFITE
ncbi:hypothetical protein DP124_12115 [Clostridium tetani]|uniref:N-acetylmuramoyl-L-alanine amidase n=1 Tax=Clostridium tetani TaxID=1513 RepID=UPI00100BDF3C|nr:N-acetylmuramoyl-L-alanine amidase [Clostridium tetani]RXI50208.1 hypothetical protein DP124_12115 [Clostridium tetani]RXI57285.1 hypothetical protein DP122_00430 [Clostridium tetani]